MSQCLVVFFFTGDPDFGGDLLRADAVVTFLLGVTRMSLVYHPAFAFLMYRIVSHALCPHGDFPTNQSGALHVGEIKLRYDIHVG